MTRADRVMDLLELLRARDVQTVQALADELGTSRRTILRDLATLRGRGWPIRSGSGPGGGVYLDRDRGLRAVHLSLDEIIALWVAAQLSLRSSTLPFSAAARSALDKILASVPEERARHLRRLVRRVIIGRLATPGSSRTSRSLPPSSSPRWNERSRRTCASRSRTSTAAADARVAPSSPTASTSSRPRGTCSRGTAPGRRRGCSGWIASDAHVYRKTNRSRRTSQA